MSFFKKVTDDSDTDTRNVKVLSPTTSGDGDDFDSGIENETIFIDEDYLLRKGMVSVKDNRGKLPINDEVRAIKHKLVNNAFGAGSESHENGNLVMITSASPNEGKTFSAINLALMLSLEKNKSVLLVDADVRKPSVNKSLGIKTYPGLIDYLKGDVESADQVIYNTSIKNLRLMPAGDSHHLSYEFLASDKMVNLAKELATRYSNRMVIFDCPPLLGVIETISLSRYVGQVVVVVEHHKSKMANVIEAVSHLDERVSCGIYHK